MSVVTITGKEERLEGRNPRKTYAPEVLKPGVKYGIPKNSDCVVTSMPEGHVVWKGKATKSISLDLDPGHYACKIFNSEHGQPGVNFAVHFYVDVDEREWSILRSMTPKMVKGMQTTEGVRYACQFTGCLETFTSIMAGLLHETEIHQGEDLLQKVRAQVKGVPEPKKAEQRQSA